jgi:DNA-binding transcriptional LysR family regulator
MADLDGMALFVRVADAGSLSAAARSLGLPKSTVSRRLTLLEGVLGSPLMHRSTRALALTDAGRIYLERARPIVRDAESAHLEIKSRSAKAIGLVRISATVTLGQAIIAPIICDLMQQEPGLRVDLRLSDQRLGVIEDNLDIAIRMGAIEDTELIARKLCSVARVLVASPTYLAGRSAPQTPSDLDGHECIVTSATLDRWTFADGEEIRVPWRFASGTIPMAIDAALAGRGLALVPKFAVNPHLADGRLLIVLDSHPLPLAQATALYPRARVASIAAKTVIDRLVRELAKTQV